MRKMIAAAIALLFSSTAAMADAEEGMLLFKQGKYQQALEIFEQAIEDNPSSGQAYYNAATCEMQLGRKSRARDYCQRALSESPDAPCAKDATVMLNRIKNGTTATSSEQETKSNARPYGGYSGEKAATAGTSRAVSRGRLMDNLMQVVPPSSGRPEVSMTAKVQVRSALSRIPESVLAELKNRNILVLLTPTLIDKRPELKNREGRGYDGYTYKSCPGMFDGRAIYICEYTMDENDDSVVHAIDPHKLSSTAYHELGHAIDYILGNLSESAEYKLAYHKDSASIPEESRTNVKYFLQKAEAGQHESCAELMALILGAPDMSGGAVSSSFPLTMTLLKRKIDGLNSPSR